MTSFRASMCSLWGLENKIRHLHPSGNYDRTLKNFNSKHFNVEDFTDKHPLFEKLHIRTLDVESDEVL